MNGCFICAKHRDMGAVPGGELMGDEHCIVSHLPLITPRGVEQTVYLGHLFVEARRHVAELGDLTGSEARSLGRLAALASACLRNATAADHVYAAVIGHGVEHLHLHLVARYPHTPREFWWTRLDEWPDAPRGGPDEVSRLADRIRAELASIV